MEVRLNDRKVEVIINRKKIKNIYFRFDDMGRLCINVGRFLSDRTILKLIEDNKGSLEKMMLKQEKKEEKDKEFWLLGNKYEIIYKESALGVEIERDALIVRNRMELDNYVKTRMIEVFQEEIEELKEKIKTPEFKLKVRKMKTRWGVCNYVKNTITLNSELIKYRRELIRYVIVHEMCHFYHHDHSSRFWALVERYYPEYKKARKELRY